MKNIYIEHIMTKIGTLLFIASIFTFISCEKDIVDKFTPLDENWSSIDEFINNTETSKTITIQNPSLDYVFETEIATYKVSQASIVDQDGSLVSEPVSLILTELNNTGDYILSNLNTKDIVGDILHNRFACKIELKSGNKTLKLQEGNPIQVYMKSDDSTIDFESTFEWISDIDNAGWFPTIDLSVYSKSWDFYVNDVHYLGDGYKMLISKTGWFSMGDFEFQLYPNTEDYGNVKITIPSEYDNFDTKIFVVHKNNTAVISVEKNDNIYSHGQILKDEVIHIIGLTTVDGKLYFGRKDFIASDDNEYSLNFKELAYFELIEELKRL